MTRDSDKTKPELIAELARLRARVDELAAAEIERGRAETERRERDDALRDVAERSSDIVLLADTAGVATYASPSVARILGYQPEEMVGRTLADFARPEELALIAARVREVLKGQAIDNVDVAVRRKDGSKAIIGWTGSPICRDGEVVGIQLLGRDVTAHRETEDALQEKEERFRLLVEGSDEVFFYVHDRDRSLTYLSPSVRWVLGYEPEEMVGRPCDDFLANESWAAKAAAVVAEELATGVRGGPFHLLFHHKNGGQIVGEVVETPVRRDGKIQCIQGFVHNVTERKHCEERFRITAEVTTDLIYEWNVADDTLEWFGDIDAMLGYAPGELPRTIKGWVDLIHPEDRARLTQSVERHRTATEPIFEEYRVQRKDGTWRYWVDRGAPELDEAGTPYKWIGGCQDVTERMSTEEALLASEKKFRLLIGHLPQRIFYKDRDSVFVSCNDNFARDLGIAPDEIAGKTDYDFYPEELAEKYRADDRRIMESGHLEEIEEAHLRDGQDLIVQVVKTPVTDEAGNVTGILGIFWDITERKRAENALRESEERFRNVYETAPLGFILWDRNCRVTDWNRRAEEMFGWTRDEVLGKDFFGFLIPESARPRVAAMVEALLRGEIEPHVVNENLTKNGETILCEWSNSVLCDREGRVTGAMSLALDITERKRAEEERLNLERQVQHAQKLESLGVLAGGIAHDFNNLLVSILGNADLALQDMSPHAPGRHGRQCGMAWRGPASPAPSARALTTSC